jgi:hypothetical protein
MRRRSPFQRLSCGLAVPLALGAACITWCSMAVAEGQGTKGTPPPKDEVAVDDDPVVIPVVSKSTLSPDGTMVGISAWVGPDETQALVADLTTRKVVWASPHDDPAWRWEAEAWLSADKLLVRRFLCGLPGANVTDPLRPPGLQGDDLILGLRALNPSDRFLLERKAAQEWHLTPLPALSFTYQSYDLWPVTGDKVLFCQPYAADPATDAHCPVFLHDLRTHETSVVMTLDQADRDHPQVPAGTVVSGGRFLLTGWDLGGDAPLQRLSLLDLRTGQSRDLPAAPAGERSSCCLSPDARTIAWFPANRDVGVLLQDADTGKVRPIAVSAGERHVGGRLVWSPDSQAVATIASGEDPREVVVISRETGTVARYPFAPGMPGKHAPRLQWGPGHQHIVCTEWFDVGIWELDLTTGRWRQWTFPDSYRRYRQSECPLEE